MNTNSELRAIVENLCTNLSTNKVPCKTNHVVLSFGCANGEWAWGIVVAAVGSVASKHKGYRPRLCGEGETPSAAIDDMLSAPAYGRWRKDLAK